MSGENRNEIGTSCVKTNGVGAEHPKIVCVTLKSFFNDELRFTENFGREIQIFGKKITWF